MNPSSITLDDIRKETNAEVKRIMRERYGEGRYLADIGAIVIDVDTVPVNSLRTDSPTIMRALLQDDEKRRFLVGSDGSTGRTYHMEVEGKIKTCRDAHNFLSKLKESNLVAQG